MKRVAERVSDKVGVTHLTFDEVLNEQLQNPVVASGYLELAIPDGPQFIMRRILQLLNADMDFPLIDPSVIDQVNASLEASSLPLYWRKAA